MLTPFVTGGKVQKTWRKGPVYRFCGSPDSGMQDAIIGGR